MTGWLIDKSALVRLAASPDAQDWADRIQRGLVRICTVTVSKSASPLVPLTIFAMPWQCLR